MSAPIHYSFQVSSFNGIRVWSVVKPRAAVMMNLETIQTKIQEETKRAEEASSKYGADSKEARVAWDVVEELEAEASHMRANQSTEDPLEEFCKDSPEADECRTYDN